MSEDFEYACENLIITYDRDPRHACAAYYYAY